MTAHPIQIASATDARFAGDCAAMLASLVHRHSPQAIHVHLLHDDSLSADELATLERIVREPGGSFSAISTMKEKALTLAASDRFPLRIWYRVFLPELLPSISRVLYLDADTLIAAPLDELWQTELGGNLVGAVTNPLYTNMVPRIVAELGLPNGQSYFNSGVLIVDLDGWRQHATTAAVLAFARTHPLVWPDQDALNAVLHRRRLRLPPRWNAMPGIWELPRSYLPYSDAEVHEAARNPAIVHFVGPYKPWHYRSRHPYRATYFRYLEGTCWQGRPIEGRSAWQAVLRRLPTVWADQTELALARWQDRRPYLMLRRRAQILRGR